MAKGQGRGHRHCECLADIAGCGDRNQSHVSPEEIARHETQTPADDKLAWQGDVGTVSILDSPVRSACL